MNPVSFVVVQCLNALALAALLCFISLGLTLIFGIMRIINFAHGALYMLGAYVGFSVAHATGQYWPVLLIAPALVGAIGVGLEATVLRPLYRRPHGAFLLVTFGLALVTAEAIRLGWGPEPHRLAIPALLDGSVSIAGEPFPVYRLFLAVAGFVVVAGLWLFLEKTRLGLIIRGTAQNAEMVHALGTDVRLVRSAVFGIGCGLAGIGGVFAAPLVTASLAMAPNAVIDTFVIVIIGGMGSFAGSLIGALLVAFVQVFGTYYFPDLALALMYLVMLTVLVVRPGGLLGKEA